jgi:hypothetical protein
MRQLGLARRCGTCSLTIKRRVALLAERGLVTLRGPQFMLTNAGRQALGPEAPKPTPWIRIEAISAVSAKDVQMRLAHPSNMSAAERTRISSLSAQKARAAAKLNRSLPFNRFAMTG